MHLRFYRLSGRLAYLWRRPVNSRPRHSVAASSMMAPPWVDGTTCNLRDFGVALAPVLALEKVHSIFDFAMNSACTRPGMDKSFMFADIENGRLRDGTAVAIAEVRTPTNCKVITRIISDRLLLMVAEQHLGHAPHQVQ